MKKILNTVLLLASSLSLTAQASTVAVITAQDLSSSEFLSQQQNPTAFFDVRQLGQRYTYSYNVTAWLGYSYGPGWGPELRTQSFALRGCIPGRSYSIQLKFHTKSVPSMTLQALRINRRGPPEPIGSVDLNDSSINGYMTFTFVARRSNEEILITHPYSSGVQTYAYLDYLQIEAW